MATYMDTLLAQTPLPNTEQAPPLRYKQNLIPHPFDQSRPENNDPTSSNRREPFTSATPKLVSTGEPASLVSERSPLPGEPVYILRQAVAVGTSRYDLYIKAKQAKDEQTRAWEQSQKEPLVEVPIKRTKQYFAIIQEMEEYSPKRAAMALDGVDGRTMTEKEEGIQKYEQFFGGLRNLEGWRRYKGTPPWEQQITVKERKELIKKAKRDKLWGSTAPKFIVSQTQEAKKVSRQVERVVWRFEDVSWVKQRTIKPRKWSYAGQLDRRVQLESGVERYGPFGIGSGVEGVGGVKSVVERGTNGSLRIQKMKRVVKKHKREIIV